MDVPLIMLGLALFAGLMMALAMMGLLMQANKELRITQEEPPRARDP